MKSSFVLLAFAAGVAVAQDSLPQCSSMCWTNMIGIATNEFGCSESDKACQCKNINFGYGVRDCSQQACNADDAQKAIAYGTNYCAGVGSPAEVSSGALPILSSALGSAGASVTGTGGGAAQSTAVTTEALVGTITGTNGDVITTTTGFSTVYSALTGSAASAASSAAASASSAVESAASSAASAASSAGASASSALASGASRISSALNSATGSANVPESTGAAPMMTGLPVAGAAGLAALLLL